MKISFSTLMLCASLQFLALNAKALFLERACSAFALYVAFSLAHFSSQAWLYSQTRLFGLTAI